MTSLLVGPLPAPAWPPGIGLRDFDEGDAREIHALLALCYANGFGAVPPFDDWWQFVTTDAEFDPALALVAADGRRIAGFALVWTSGFIKDIVVHPQWRRRGLGAAMLAEIARRVSARGLPAVSLKVSPGNTDARHLYTRTGFRRDD